MKWIFLIMALWLAECPYRIYSKHWVEFVIGLLSVLFAVCAGMLIVFEMKEVKND